MFLQLVVCVCVCLCDITDLKIGDDIPRVLAEEWTRELPKKIGQLTRLQELQLSATVRVLRADEVQRPPRSGSMR